MYSPSILFMHKIIALVAFYFCWFAASAQQSDFISLKKRDRTIQHYFSGSFIEFIHRNGSYISGSVSLVQKDSIYITHYDVRMVPNQWGTRNADTLAKYSLRFHYKDIAAIPKPGKGFEFIRNGTLFMIGGGGYAFLHTTNGLIQKKEIYPATIAVAGGVALLGFGMRKLRKYEYTLGGKYNIHYVNMGALQQP